MIYYTDKLYMYIDHVICELLRIPSNATVETLGITTYFQIACLDSKIDRMMHISERIKTSFFSKHFIYEYSLIV